MRSDNAETHNCVGKKSVRNGCDTERTDVNSWNASNQLEHNSAGTVVCLLRRSQISKVYDRSIQFSRIPCTRTTLDSPQQLNGEFVLFGCSFLGRSAFLRNATLLLPFIGSYVIVSSPIVVFVCSLLCFVVDVVVVVVLAIVPYRMSPFVVRDSQCNRVQMNRL